MYAEILDGNKRQINLSLLQDHHHYKAYGNGVGRHL